MVDVDAVEDIIACETPREARRVAVIDAPVLVDEALKVSDEVVVWCDDVRARPDTCAPGVTLPDRLEPDVLAGVDLVWLRLPRALGALDDYAELAANHADGDVRLVAGGRNKDMTHSMNGVLERHFVEVSASLGRRKCRVLHAADPDPRTDEWPKRQRHEVTIGARTFALELHARGLTFAGTKVDDGTRLLLRHLDEVPRGDVVDLGCGNGVVSAALSKLGQPSIQAIDVSWAAVEATRLTAEANSADVTVHWADGLSPIADASVDAVVTNPPFHQGAARESDPTIDMLRDCARILRPGGEVWCVFNSHLPWRKVLNEHVGRTLVVDQNPHYTLTRTLARG